MSEKSKYSNLVAVSRFLANKCGIVMDEEMINGKLSFHSFSFSIKLTRRTTHRYPEEGLCVNCQVARSAGPRVQVSISAAVQHRGCRGPQRGLHFFLFFFCLHLFPSFPVALLQPLSIAHNRNSQPEETLPKLPVIKLLVMRPPMVRLSTLFRPESNNPFLFCSLL